MNKISNKLYLDKTNELLDYCKDQLILDNPEYLTKVKMNLYAGNTDPKIRLFEIKGDKIILPFGELKNVWKYIKDFDYSLEFDARPINVKSHGNINLYDYQEKAIQECIKAKNGILVSPAGSGKTTIAVELISRIKQKTLWITHTRDLLFQSKKRFEQNYDCRVGEISSGKIDIQDVTFALIQTMQNMDLTEIKKEFGLIIVDEAHRCSGSPSRYTMFSKVLNNLSCRNKIGLTATPHRADGLIRATYSLLGEVFYQVPKLEVADKTIKAVVEPCYTKFDIEFMGESYNSDGTIVYSKMINEISANRERNQYIVDIIHENQHKNILVLSDRIDQLKYIKDKCGFGVFVDGKTNKKEREENMEKMRFGKESLLFASYSLAKEGLDIPRLEILILATPKKDDAVIIQSVGRIERKFEGKESPIVYDLIDNIGICKRMFSIRKRIYGKNLNKIIY